MLSDSWRDQWVAMLGVPCFEGNRIDVLRNGDAIFPAMLEAVDHATRTIEFVTYIYWTGAIAQKFAESLARAAERGVVVRVLLDSFGAQHMDESLVNRMIDAGAEVRWFRPLVRWKVWKDDHRTHRKILVCDRRVGFTGGVGIAEQWEGDARNEKEWRDTHFRIEGPAVDGLRGAFIGDWFETENSLGAMTTEVQAAEPAGATPIQVVRSTACVGWSDVATVLRLALVLARERLWITTAYFVPDDTASGLLIAAAKRGVDVRVIVPGPHMDKTLCQLATDDVIEPLVAGGVKMFRFQPTMMHAKILTVDQRLAVIGSANFNQRSMRKDDEICLTAFDESLVATLEAHFEADQIRSNMIEHDDWKERSAAQQAQEAAVRPVRDEL